ncbi:AAA family ATPase [Chromobacterium sp. IIBBL 290-4]|uniref:AAA family ATPase n=1 Tax=Chromobacterium sp. IIBBL 290-4 TaxID=2953890 RepID=UPI0020B66F46|nr:AAA family ATPase [Chromobacterium sp. IIBBL 290-4]UTH74543.1 AAA family ATPase [Chromobacterium sp. IIBBL 290-4]
MQTFFLAPTGFNAGLTSVTLGAIRSLEQAGLRVGFVKPIAQDTKDGEAERSTHFAHAICRLNPPQPISMERVEHLLSQGQVDQLMEEVVSLFQQASQNVDVVIVEGLVPDQKQVFSTFLNTKIARNLQAQTILVSSVKDLGAAEIGRTTGNEHPGLRRANRVGYILNHVLPSADRAELARRGAAIRQSEKGRPALLA